MRDRETETLVLQIISMNEPQVNRGLGGFFSVLALASSRFTAHVSFKI